MLDPELGAFMEEALLEQAKGGPNANRPAPERTKPRASGLDCARSAFYYLTGAEQLPKRATSAAATSAGQALESDVLDHLEYALSKRFGRKIVGERQVPVETDWCTGTLDWWNEELKMLADAKTTGPASFSFSARGFEDKYKSQLTIYGTAKGAELCVVPLRANGKKDDDQTPGIYAVEVFAPDPAVYAAAEARARAAMAGKETGTAPPPTFARGYWLCRSYCDYRHLCPSGG
jgi:hypothetical protein